MFGFEWWFILAVVSAIGGGIFIFCTKVAAERDYDAVLISSVGLILSVPVLGILALLYGDGSGFGLSLVIPIVVIGFAFIAVHLLRNRALQCIDTAIFFPIYKTVTPALVIIAGIFIYQESFTDKEWVGVGLSLLVPLLLVSQAEKERQKDLYRGLRLLGLSCVFSLIATVALKHATSLTTNTLLLVAVTNAVTATLGGLLMVYESKSQSILKRIQSSWHRDFIVLTLIMAVMQVFGYLALVYAISLGPLGIVYTINSLYILIPIVLSIIFYNEHWNLRKVIAIILSVAALALLQ